MLTKKFVQGSKDSITLRRCNIDRIHLNVFQGVDEPRTNWLNNLSAITINVVLRRRNKNITIVNTNARAAHMLSTFYNANFEFYKPDHYAINDGNGTVTYPTTYNYSPLTIKFGGIINLDGDDELYIELNCPNNAWSKVHPMNYATISAPNAIGVEIATPTMVIQTVPSGTGEHQFSLGDNVTRICLLRTDENVFTAPDGDDPISGDDEIKARTYINTLNLDSDKLDKTFNYEDLISMKHDLFEVQGILYRRRYQYLIHDGIELDAVQINAQFNPNNVPVGGIQLAYYQFIFDAETTAKAKMLMAQHNSINSEKLI